MSIQNMATGFGLKFIGLGVVIGLMQVSVAWAGDGAAKTTQELFNEARAARKAGELITAVRLLKEVYERDPTPSLLNNMGKLYDELGWYREAVETYEKVANDVAADIRLRNFDASRIAILKPKLGKAWLKATLAPKNARLWIDGNLAQRWSEEEIGLVPGRRWLEIRVPGSTTTTLTALELPRDRRTPYRVDLASDTSTTHGILELPADLGSLTGIVYGTTSLGSPVASLRSIKVPAGPMKFQFQFPEQTLERSVVIEAGEVQTVNLDLAPIKPPAVSEPSSVLNWTLIGGGALLLGAGAGLYLNGQLKSSELNDAIDNESPVVSFSQNDAKSLRDSANIEVPLGITLATLGVGALIAGLVLALNTDITTKESVLGPAMIVPSPDGSVQLFVTF